jgi:YHS domain-containing protein
MFKTNKMKTRNLIATFVLLSSPLMLAEGGHKHEEHGGGEITKKVEAKPYKLTTCIVSDEKLGEMGEPFVFTHEGQEIKLCCKSCKKKFDKDPAKYLKKLSEAK